MKNMGSNMKNIRSYIQIYLASILLLFTNIALADVLFSHGGDSIFFDEANNNYVLKYVSTSGQINEVIWTPPSDVMAKVKAKYKSLKDGSIKYKYEIKVDDDSNQSLVAFRFYTSLNGDFYSDKPKKWKEIIRNSYDENELGKWVNWYTTSSPVKAGKKIDNFEVKGMALPGYSVAFVEGETGILSYPDYGPNIEVQTYFEEDIVSKHFNGKAINIAVPMIPISVPFNSVETYSSFHNFLLGYIDKGFIEPSISISLTDASTAVLTALTANDVDVALSNLKAVKKLVEGEYENHKDKKDHGESEEGKPQPLIIKELRKILKFNLKFIKKKLKGHSEHDD